MKSVADIVINNKRRESVSFRRPGHKSNEKMFAKAGFGDFFNSVIKEDISLMPYDAVKSLMENYADLYGAMYSEVVVTGSDDGIIAAILSTVSNGGKLIVCRDVHEASFRAMKLGQIQPVYCKPRNIGEMRQTCRENEDAEAILISSPSYQGELSDVQAIADIAHKHNMILIVDQSYGAHLKFFDAVTGTRTTAEDLGADVVINAMDTSLLGMTGGAIINICSNRIDLDRLEDKLELLQPQSCNNLILASLDINEKIMRRWGGDMVVSWSNDLRYVYSRLEAINGVEVISGDGVDISKIRISLAGIGVSGEQFKKELLNAGIVPEKVFGDYVMLMTGAGNKREDYMELIKVVREITNNYAIGAHEEKQQLEAPKFTLGVTNIPNEKDLVPLYKADGRVLYNSIVTYPPGEAIACPGEIMNLELISYIAHALENEQLVDGLDEEGWVYVGLE